MNVAPPRGASRAALLGLVALTLAALAVRARLVPGLWNADALHYGALLAGDESPGLSNRDFRRLFLALARAGWAAAGDLPIGASLPSLLLGVAAVPLTWLAARRALGAAAALLPAAVVAFVPVAIEESSRPSADGPLAAFGAALLWLLTCLEDADPRRRRTALLGVGLVAGAGFVFKETFALVALPAAAWLGFAAARARIAWRELAFAAAPALVVVALDHWTSPSVAGGRLALVDARMAALRGLGDDAPRRLGFGPLFSMTTDAQRWGGLFLVAAAATAAAVLAPAAASPAAWLAVGTVLAVWFLPISLRTYALLPMAHPRYLLGALPAMATLVFLPFHGPPPGARRRVAAALAGGAALWVARHDLALAAAVVVGAAAALAPARFRGAAPWALGAALVAALVPAGGAWTQAARCAFLLPAAAAFVRPALAKAACAAALVAAGLAADAALAPRRAAVEAMTSLPAAVADARRVFATRDVARRLALATIDGTRVVASPWDAADAAAGRLPAAFEVGDVAVCGAADVPAGAALVVEPHGPAVIVRARRE